MKLPDRHEAFAALHGSGTFVIPNPWDVGSARVMAAMGAKALATSSGAFAFTQGLPDMGTMSRDASLAHAQDIIAATDLPVSGDFENGFADDPDGVAETIRLAGEIGLSGCGIEDTQMIDGNPAYDFDLAVERIRAAAAAARALGRPFVLVARADGVLTGHYDLAEAIRRLQAFEAAGADCLYAPGFGGRAELSQLMAAVTKPVNVLTIGPMRDLTVEDFAAMGVRRLSTGAAIARATHKTLIDVTGAMLREGRFDGLHGVAPAKVTDPLLREGAGDD